MKITFPHLGNSYFAAKSLFDGLGIDYVIPPFCNKEALEIGSKYSPEEICLPFKIMMGNYIQSIRQGADTILIVGSCGPCRFGEYCELQMNILKSLGYNLQFIVLDQPRDIGVKELLRRINIISKNSTKSNIEKLRAVQYASKVISLIEEIQQKAYYFSGFEKNKGECKRLLIECKSQAADCNIPGETIKILIKYLNKIKNIEKDKSKRPLQVAIIGEIYTIIEPFSNLYIEDKLMDYGVSIKRRITPVWWAKNSALTLLRLNSLDIRRASKKYLPLYIGGHARECVGEAVLAAEEKLDGAIQIYPMGCMPEIVAKAILPTISKDKDFPIMSLVVDEMTGEAGYITRIEAFLDLLERRKNNVLSWS